MSTALLAAGCAKGPRHAPRPISPNDKLNVAGIGVGGKGSVDIGEICKGNNVIALCDVDDRQARGTFKKFPDARTYRDFRVMLEKEYNNIDAVHVSTPDNVHAVAAMACMELGKHVYVQKPLTHDIYEARELMKAARRYKVATQMGNQGHASMGLWMVTDWIRNGAIGPVREVHCFTDRPGHFWTQPAPHPTETPPVPDTLSWDLWLGPAPVRPYHPCYLPDEWRGWWDFGCGALGDMGCHIMDPPYTALNLGYPTAVEAETSGHNGETYPAWSVVRYEFPARGDMPPCTLTWYDGGKMPARPEGLPDDVTLGDGGTNGTLFIGDDAMLTCGCYGDSARVIPYKKVETSVEPPELVGHYEQWVNACKGGPPAGGNFDYAAPFSEMVLLGNLAIRVGKRIEYDAESLNVTNCPEANQYIRREYRKGWRL
ncbi:MAG TPA: Gfo/Idh/MocA family oxidoreductase [Candidatus Hydrogenedentes bacterium]|nr:Gfo/Idh/MocA family oxidoreductase [Candidatus Hydrogenedentota bacterium]HPG69769.1 Gfo/Idh/MocA family oxidoreductase [Candidatus Hydrogenedentota bacterium]